LRLLNKPSIPLVVASIITHNPPVYECLKGKLINYHALAANIKSEVEKKAGKTTTVNTIVVAIMRFFDSIEETGEAREGPLRVLKAARITLASDVVDVTIKTKKSELLPMVKVIAELSSTLSEPIHLFQLSNSIKLIADEVEYSTLIRGSLGRGHITKETNKLSRLDIHLSPDIETTPEFGLFLTELLYRHGIRIHQTYIGEETILILDRDEGPKAYEILREEIDRSRTATVAMAPEPLISK
jgi:hypothetical protein